MLPRHIFRAYDIRGVYDKDLTDGGMEFIGKALGTLLFEKGMKEVVVGSDTRISSDRLLEALIKGLVSTGMHVYNVGKTSSGVTLLAAKELGKDVGAYVTASHLPAEWNGLKVYYGDGEAMGEEEIMALYDIIEKDVFTSGEGTVENIEFKDGYIAFMKRHLEIGKPNIVLDCGGGSACLIAPSLFRAFGIEPKMLFCEVDPYFRGRPSDPMKIENIKGLIEETKNGYDIGIGFDGDVDRIAVIDDEGFFLSAEQIGMIIAKEMLEDRKGVVVATVPCSMAVEEILVPLGADVVRIRVGHTFLIKEIKKRNALLGFEDSGHMVLPEYTLFDDALLISLKLMEVMHKTGKKLSKLRKELPNYPKKKVTVECADEKKFDVIERLKDRCVSDYKNVLTIDGVKIIFDDAWVLIRASNTSPKIRVTVEAKSEKRVDELLDEFSKMVREEVSK
ncbi:MAG: phosphomannomutase/phosphoglucomutase [Candidatus Diapherotrites archaeon]|nr:phosphomannomutase/phosphoglucomutase [Candidatus Diapherotrites archaeon]